MLSFALLLTRAVAANDEPFGSGVVVGRPAGAARYFTVVDAGRRGLDAPGAVWVLGRTGDWPDAFPHSGTRIWLGASSHNLLGPPAADLPGRKRVIQRRFNVIVPRARVSETASTLRERSEG
ncbi:hypothetical protein JL721_9147 [Aureococcus anophagefferens]|nr:hypothetical protein JL721_9147 [Aureococcus anophagefferens]